MPLFYSSCCKTLTCIVELHCFIQWKVVWEPSLGHSISIAVTLSVHQFIKGLRDDKMASSHRPGLCCCIRKEAVDPTFTENKAHRAYSQDFGGHFCGCWCLDCTCWSFKYSHSLQRSERSSWVGLNFWKHLKSSIRRGVSAMAWLFGKTMLLLLSIPFNS